MVVGQFMLLSEIHPDDMYRWFMEFSIDSYDWVMVPNVYGMIGYNDGGKTTTKPYISSSNYILKMSNYSRGKGVKSWDYLWRCMYYRFIHENTQVLNDNARTRRMVWQMNNMKPTELKVLLDDADEYIDSITN
jgi:deoxyribodipyrimidine photolyase-related protein